MATLTVTRQDVQVFATSASNAQVDALLAGTLARAKRIAPCLFSEDPTPPSADALAEAKDIIVQAVVRNIEAGTGEVTTLIAGPMQQTVDTTKRRTVRLRPDEIRELQNLCGIKRGGAFTIALGYDATDFGTEDWTPDDAA